MSILAKLELKSITKSTKADPIESRRVRLVEKLTEQIEVFKAVQSGKEYYRNKEQTRLDPNGDKHKETIQQKVNPFFFKQDNGWYVQCRYGSRVLNIYNKHNAVFVNDFKDIGNVLNTFIEAVRLGEFDKSIASVMLKRK